MVKYISLLLIFFLAACSDTEEQNPRIGSQYVYKSDNIVVAVYLRTQSDVKITIFENGHYTYQDIRGTATGSWPTYCYEFDELVIDCAYENSKTFNATVKTNTCGTVIPRRMLFSEYRHALDRNGDSILDSYQQLSK